MSHSIASLFMVLATYVLAVPRLASQTITGHVTNAVTGDGVPGVKVRVFPANGPPADGYSVDTDAKGRFRIEER
jgi:hypothetical protein